MRNESINIGALLFNTQDHSTKFQLIPNSSFKIHGLAVSQYQKDLFQTTMKYLDFTLKKMGTNFSVHLLDDTIEEKLPVQIRFSNPQPIMTSNSEIIFQKLISEYVGDEYFKSIDNSVVLTPKEKMIDILNAHKLLGDKIKKNVKIRPSKSVEMNFTIDFAYGENDCLNLIDSSPMTENALSDWYLKMVMLSSRYDHDSSILLLNDSKSSINGDKKVSEMIEDLQHDNRIKSIDIGSDAILNTLLTEIKENSVTSSELDSLIARNHFIAS